MAVLSGGTAPGVTGPADPIDAGLSDPPVASVAQPGRDAALSITSVGGYQVLLIVLGVLVLFSDGFDAQMAGLVAPAISGAWHVPSAAFAPVFAANVFGLMIGGMAITVIADTLGRRPVIIVSVIAFGIASLTTTTVHTIGAFAITRFVGGLALGGAMPCMIAGTSEYIPIRYRTRISVLMSTAWSAGILVCGITTGHFVEPLGWQSLFWIGGAIPLVLTPALIGWLPESPAFLIAKGRLDGLAATLDRIDPALKATVGRAPPSARSFPVAALFKGRYLAITPLLWAAYFCAGGTIYFFLNWLPIFVKEAGYAPSQAGYIAAFYQLGGLVGAIAISFMLDRRGAFGLAASSVGAAVVVGLLGSAAGSLPLLALAATASGALVVGSQNSANAYVGGRLYPDEIRATGLGWALGWVRLSGVLAGSLAAGVLIGWHLGAANTLRIIAIPELLAAVAFLGVGLAAQRQTAAVLGD